MKKGLSPIIGVTLLILVTIAIAGTIFGFSRTLVQDVTVESEIRQKFQAEQLDVGSVSKKGTGIEFAVRRGSSTFSELQEVKKQTTTTEHTEADIVIVVDLSGNNLLSDGPKEDIISLISALDLSESKDRAAIISFGNTAEIQQPFTTDTDLLNNTIQDLSAEGQSNLLSGLEEIQTLFFNEGRSKALKVVLLFTDGVIEVSRDQIIQLADTLRQKNVLFFAIGMGSEVDTAFLETLTTEQAYYSEALNDIDFTNAVTHLEDLVLPQTQKTTTKTTNIPQFLQVIVTKGGETYTAFIDEKVVDPNSVEVYYLDLPEGFGGSEAIKSVDVHLGAIVNNKRITTEQAATWNS